MLRLMSNSVPVNTQEELGNVASFLQLQSTLIRHRNGAFRKRHSNRSNFNENACFAFLCGQKAFRKRRGFDNHDISLPEFYSKTDPKCPTIVAFTSSSGVLWT